MDWSQRTIEWAAGFLSMTLIFWMKFTKIGHYINIYWWLAKQRKSSNYKITFVRIYFLNSLEILVMQIQDTFEQTFSI